MKNLCLILSVCFLPLLVSAQLEDYLPGTPASRAQVRKNYKQYILTHKIKTVSKWREDTLTHTNQPEKFVSFTSEGDTIISYDYFSPSCYKRVINRDSHGKVTGELRFTSSDTLNPDVVIKYQIMTGKVTESRLLTLAGRHCLKRETYQYDKSGGFQKVERFDSTSKFPVETDRYTYDKGNLVSVKLDLRDSSQGPESKKMHTVSSRYYEYDDARRVKTIKYYRNDQERLLRTESFKYDEMGNLISYQGFSDNPSLSASMSYDEKRSIILCEFRDGAGFLKRSVSSTYGKNESLVQETETLYNEEKVPIQKKTYKYNYFKDDNISGCEVFIGKKRKARSGYEYQYYKTAK